MFTGVETGADEDAVLGLTGGDVVVAGAVAGAVGVCAAVDVPDTG